MEKSHIEEKEQDCGISKAIAKEIFQPCTKPLISQSKKLWILFTGTEKLLNFLGL